MSFMIGFAIASLIASATQTVISINMERRAESRREDELAIAAEQARAKAADEAKVQAANARRLISRQRANYAAAGFALDQEDSTPLIVLQQSSADAVDEYNRILKYGEWEASSYERTADWISDTSGIRTAAGILEGAGTLLGGVSDVYSIGDPTKFMS